MERKSDLLGRVELGRDEEGDRAPSPILSLPRCAVAPLAPHHHPSIPASNSLIRAVKTDGAGGK